MYKLQNLTTAVCTFPSDGAYTVVKDLLPLSQKIQDRTQDPRGLSSGCVEHRQDGDGEKPKTRACIRWFSEKNSVCSTYVEKTSVSRFFRMNTVLFCVPLEGYPRCYVKETGTRSNLTHKRSSSMKNGVVSSSLLLTRSDQRRGYLDEFEIQRHLSDLTLAFFARHPSKNKTSINSTMLRHIGSK